MRSCFRVRAKALDLACGAGRNGIWLAKRGMNVTLVDVSDVALEKAQERAHSLGLLAKLRLYRLDLEEPLPFAPLFDVLLLMNYLDRERRDAFVELVVEDGLIVACHPTTGRYAVALTELEDWVGRLGLELLASREVDGEAGVIARRSPPKREPEREPDEPSASEGPYR